MTYVVTYSIWDNYHNKWIDEGVVVKAQSPQEASSKGEAAIKMTHSGTTYSPKYIAIL